MNTWDIILPHRRLINRSLRKASEGLRSRIEGYQLEYKREIERYSAEIEQAKTDKDRDFDNVKLSLVNELSKNIVSFDAVQEDLLKYVDLYLRRQCLNKIEEIKTLEMHTLIEYIYFLTEQMNLIGKEIEILEARKDKLVIQAKVDDIIELIGLSGCDLTVGSNDDARLLLEKVSKLVDACKDSFTKLALQRLCAVLQERVEFLPIIQYISWTIQQKKQLSKQLSSERRKIISNKNEKTNELLQLGEDIYSLNCSLEEQARTVREYWAIPITQLNVQISSMYTKIKALHSTIESEKSNQNRLFDELKETNEQLQRMMNEHSNDSYTWERLQRDKANCKDDISSSKSKVGMAYEKINQLKTEIYSLKSKRQQWFAREQMIYTLCKQNRVDLIPDNTSQESDECRIINKRRAELELRRIEQERLAEQRSMEESASIQQRKKEKEVELFALIENAEKSQAEKFAIFAQASLQLSSSKKRDTRFFLLKILDTEEIRRAKQALQVADSQKKSADNHLSKLKTELAKAISDFDRQIESCRLLPYRPTTDEKDEIEQLENRKAELENKQNKKRSARRMEGNESSN